MREASLRYSSLKLSVLDVKGERAVSALLKLTEVDVVR